MIEHLHYHPIHVDEYCNFRTSLGRKIESGDHAAFTELIRRSSPSALRSIRAIARNAANAEDVMQDTVVNALKALGSFDQRSKFTTWLTSIAVNNALLLLRRRRNKIEISLDATSAESDTSPLQTAEWTQNKR